MPDFGMPLADAVAPQRLQEERTKLRAWGETHAELVAEIKGLVSEERIASK
jgi:hypothetical protein